MDFNDCKYVELSNQSRPSDSRHSRTPVDLCDKVMIVTKVNKINKATKATKKTKVKYIQHEKGKEPKILTEIDKLLAGQPLLGHKPMMPENLTEGWLL